MTKKTTIDTSEPYTGAMRGTMHEHQANLGADQKSSLGRFPATRP